MELQTPAHLGPSSLSHPLDGKAAGLEGTPGPCHLSFEGFEATGRAHWELESQ
jgi:hypothetical protein